SPSARDRDRNFDSEPANDPGDEPADRAARKTSGAPTGQRHRADEPSVRRLGEGAGDRAALHPTRQAEPERVHRALQPDAPNRGPNRLRLRFGRTGAEDHGGMAREIQRAAASRLPRASAAAHLPAEGNHHRRVQLQTVTLTGKLTHTPAE